MDGSYGIKTKDGREFVVRPVTEEDIPQVAANVNSVAKERVYIANEGIEDVERFGNAIFEQVKWGNWIFMVAEVGGKVVGHFNLQIGYPAKRRHTAYIGTILTKEYRNLGIGTEMMRIAMEKAKEKEVEKVFLSVFSTNTGAIDYYKKCGFEIEGVLKKQFMIDGKYVDEVYMAKWL